MKTIHARDLRLRLDGGRVLLLNVLAEDAFEKEHIPGSLNVPDQAPDFLSRVERLAGSKAQPIVVYCASLDCQASPTAARRLEQAGFTDVTDFEGGLAEWKAAKFRVESGSPAHSH